jgi:hypothetical protein
MKDGVSVIRNLAATGTIPGMVERAALEYAGHPALIDDSTTVTFDELLERVRATAGAMMEAGVETGERSRFRPPNSCQWSVASLAVLFAGGTVVPVMVVPTLSAPAPGSLLRYSISHGPQGLDERSRALWMIRVVRIDRERAKYSVISSCSRTGVGGAPMTHSVP